MGHLAIVQQLLKHLAAQGSKPDLSQGLGWACKGGHAAVVKELLEHGIAASAHALRIACGEGQEACARLLLQHGASVGAAD